MNAIDQYYRLEIRPTSCRHQMTSTSFRDAEPTFQHSLLGNRVLRPSRKMDFTVVLLYDSVDGSAAI